jgi:hypothetical protein
MQKLIRLLLLPILAIGLGFSAPAPTSNPTARAQSDVHVSDAQLESTIRTKLAKSKIGKDGFRFKVAHGVVTWEGSTQIGQHKGAATRMARSSGAAQVINNIQVAGGNKPGTPMKKAYVQ